MVSLDFSPDFATVVDNQVSVSVKLNGGVAPFDVDTAHLQGIKHKEVANIGSSQQTFDSAGKYTARDVAWYLQSASFTQAGAVGARITYGSSIYTVLDANYQAVDRVWRCISRLIKVLDIKVTIRKLVYTKGVSGAAEATPVDLYTNIGAHIEEISSDEKTLDGQHYTGKLFKIYLETDYELTKDNQIVDADGTIYKHVSYDGETLEELATFTGAVTPFPRAA